MIRHWASRRAALLGAIVLGAPLALGPAAHSLAQSAAAAATPPAASVPLQAGPGAALEAAKAAAATNQQALEKLEASVSDSKAKADALRQEVAAMNGDRAKQNAALIAAGEKVKLAEIEVGSMQERLTALAEAEGQVHARLDGADVSVSNMLAALERISLNPPPALIVDPADALGSARSAMLISAILPQLRAKADQVVADLKHLAEIKAQALQQHAELRANFAVLQEEQTRIAALIAARQQNITQTAAQLDAADKEAAAMEAKANSLKQLVAELTARADAVSAAASSARPNLPAMTPEAVRTAFANTARTSPAIPFASARGYLTLPAAGDGVETFGADDGLGGIAKGVSLATQPGAPVVAPADGWVLYKGPYLNYGQIIILNPGENYTIVLAGLDAVQVAVGQFVLEGQPLGTMGSRTIGRTATAGAGVSQPTLYIELRKNDQPVDPSGWWAPPANTTQSG